MTTTRAEQRRRTREALLEAAAQEFEARGYASATLQATADRLGLTRGTVLFHYRSKDELRDALITWADEQLFGALVPAGADEDDREAEHPEGTRTRDGLETSVHLLADRYLSDVRVRAGVDLQTDRDRGSDADPRWRSALVERLAPRVGGPGTGRPTAAAAMFVGLLTAVPWRGGRALHEAIDYYLRAVLPPDGTA